MTEIRGPDYELAEKDYMLGMKYKDIADKYNVSINTVKSWKQRYNWNRKGVHTNKESVHTKDNKDTRKRSGNPNPENQFTKRNKEAEKHGFFSKYLPDETLDIIQEINEKDPLDILWENIQIQYAAIIRAQRIMFVTDKEEMIKELKKSKIKTTNRKTEKTSSDSMEEEYEYEFQFAWDRQATFLNAQSRAMAELRNMIKQYDDLLNINRDMATEEQRLRIEKLKVDIEKVSGADKDKPIEIVIKRKGED